MEVKLRTRENILATNGARSDARAPRVFGSEESDGGQCSAGHRGTSEAVAEECSEAGEPDGKDPSDEEVRLIQKQRGQVVAVGAGQKKGVGRMVIVAGDLHMRCS